MDDLPNEIDLHFWPAGGLMATGGGSIGRCALFRSAGTCGLLFVNLHLPNGIGSFHSWVVEMKDAHQNVASPWQRRPITPKPPFRKGQTLTNALMATWPLNTLICIHLNFMQMNHRPTSHVT